MELAKILGSFVSKRRRELAMSQTDLAEQAEISRAMLIKLESPEGSNAAIENVNNIFKALKVTFSDFDMYIQKTGTAKDQLENNIKSEADLEKLMKAINE